MKVREHVLKENFIGYGFWSGKKLEQYCQQLAANG